MLPVRQSARLGADGAGLRGLHANFCGVPADLDYLRGKGFGHLYVSDVPQRHSNESLSVVEHLYGVVRPAFPSVNGLTQNRINR
jgi:hypothetical protein